MLDDIGVFSSISKLPLRQKYCVIAWPCYCSFQFFHSPLPQVWRVCCLWQERTDICREVLFVLIHIFIGYVNAMCFPYFPHSNHMKPEFSPLIFIGWLSWVVLGLRAGWRFLVEFISKASIYFDIDFIGTTEFILVGSMSHQSD